MTSQAEEQRSRLNATAVSVVVAGHLTLQFAKRRLVRPAVAPAGAR